MEAYTVTFNIDQMTKETEVKSISRYGAIKAAAIELGLIPDFPLVFLTTIAVVKKITKKPSGRPRLD